jgi:AraC family transcriptional regulator
MSPEEGTCSVEENTEKSARLSEVVIESLDVNCTTEQMSRRAYHSRTQFYRLFRALIEETPAAMRRRLLLERAAFQLRTTSKSVTDIALDANYNSLEAFTRAFGKAFHVSPSLYRRIGCGHIHLPSPNKIHFLNPGSQPKGEIEMDLFDRFAGNDSWHTRRLLEYANTLSDEQLDKQLNAVVEILPWRETTKTLRQLLENIIFTKEVWTAALAGSEMPHINGTPPEQRTPAAMLARLEATDTELHRIFSEVRNRGDWDTTFVDALCEPAETFTFGGVFAHIITFNAHRRLMALDALRQLGVQVEGFGCPIEYEQTVAPWNQEVGTKR